MLKSYPESTGRLQYIDGLRALAVVAVIAYHFELGIAPNGFLGVDVFFVISGYVVCRSLTAASSIHQSFYDYVEHFYRRRFWRLIPALVVMVVATLFLSVLFIPPAYLSRLVLFTALGAMTGVANLVLAFASASNYFDQMTGYNPFLHTWSLGVEEQFYIIFPLVIWLVVKRKHWSLVLVLLAVASFLTAFSGSRENPEYAFYTLSSRFWELAAGALSYLFAPRVRHLIAGIVAGWIGITMVLASFIWPAAVAVPFPGAILPTLGVAILMWSAATGGTPSSRLSAESLLSWGAAVYIGRISYSLYLWHWPVVVLMRWTIGYTNPLHLVAATVLTMALAVASYHFIEQPFQNTKRARVQLRPLRFIVTAACIAVAPLAVLFEGSKRAYSDDQLLGQLSVVQKQFGWLYYQLPMRGIQIPPPYEPGKPAMVLIGDSHAGMLGGVAPVVAEEAGLSIRITDGCSYGLQGPIGSKDCETFIDEARPGDVVVFSAINMTRYVNQDGGPMPEPSPDNPAAVESHKLAAAEFTKIAQRLRERGVAVVYKSPLPMFHYIAFRCSDWFNHINPICAVGPSQSRESLLARAKPSLDGLASVEREVPGLVVWNAFDVMCPGAECEVYNEDGHPLFFDQDHLSGWGAERLLPSFKKAVQDALKAAAHPPP